MIRFYILSLIVWKNDGPSDEASDLIGTIPLVFGRLNVAGFPMTTGLAATVGSTIISVIFAFTKLGSIADGLKNEYKNYFCLNSWSILDDTLLLSTCPT